MDLVIKASSLVVFRDLLKDKVFSLFIKLLESIEYSNKDGIITESEMKNIQNSSMHFIKKAETLLNMF